MAGVHGERRRPHASLGADKRDDAAKLLGHGVHQNTTHGLIERLWRDRVLEALGHTGPHRLEHHVRIERGGDEHDASARILLAKGCKSGRQLALATDVDDERGRRGCPRARRSDCRGRRDPTFSPADRRASSS